MSRKYFIHTEIDGWPKRCRITGLDHDVLSANEMRILLTELGNSLREIEKAEELDHACKVATILKQSLEVEKTKDREINTNDLKKNI